MDERELAGMVGRLMSRLDAALCGSPFPANIQVVIRPIYTWPDGKLVVWVTVNTPN